MSQPVYQPPFASVDGFRLTGYIDSGQFGDVWRAERDGRFYAVKILRPEAVDQVGLERFRREVELISSVGQENVVAYAGSGVAITGTRSFYWLAMPLLEGRTLKAELEAGGGRLVPGRVRNVGRQIALGLQAVHEKGVIHRDLKPANAFVCSDGTVKLLDFGLCRFLDASTLTVRGWVPGTPAYMAPEQLWGRPDVGSDLHALGVILYELLVGRRPYLGSNTAELCAAILNETAEAPRGFDPTIPEDLEDLVLALLEKQPFDRPPSAGEVAEALVPQLGVAISARPQPHPRDARPVIFFRVGNVDAEAVAEACATEDVPDGAVVGISEQYALSRARQAIKAYNGALGVDPLTPRLSFASFAKAKTLAGLSYSPGMSPYRPSHFKNDPEARKQFVRNCLREQDEREGNPLFAPTLAMQSEESEWVAINGKLIDDAVRANVWGKPLYAQVAISFDAISSEAAQIALANRLRREGIVANWLMFDPLSAQATAEELVWALRFALLLQDSGAKSVIARAGSLRHFFLAFGVAGVEYGLGRRTQYKLADYYQRGPGGPGRAPTWFEFPSLLAAMPADQARLALEAGFLPESDCRCRSCAASESAAERVDHAAAHNAHAALFDRARLDAIRPVDRVALLEEQLVAARTLYRRLRLAEVLARPGAHLAVWPAAIAAARESGLLESGRISGRRVSGL